MGNIIGLASGVRLPDFKLPNLPDMRMPDINIRDISRSLNPTEEEARLDKKRYEIELILYRQVRITLLPYHIDTYAHSYTMHAYMRTYG